MFEKIKYWLIDQLAHNVMIDLLIVVTLTFIFAYGWGWHANATWGLHYDLSSLQQAYMYLAGQLNANHLINSGLNSPIGSK